ncbi:MAG: hypothetical protein AAFN41_14545, partial [Planctomycetota bacterium]
MNKSLCLLASAGLSISAGFASAQPFELGLQGRVIDIVDPSGVFAGIEVGQIVDGVIELDLGAANTLDGADFSSGGVEIGLFDALGFNLELPSADFVGDAPLLVVLDDIDSFPGIGDTVAVFADLLEVPAGTEAAVIAEFNAGPDLFTGTTPDQAATLDLTQ